METKILQCLGTDRKTDRQINRHTDRKTERQTERPKEVIELRIFLSPIRFAALNCMQMRRMKIALTPFFF